MKLSIIIPAYNESKRLPATLLNINKYLSKQDYNYEIIVVNDGSKDNTAVIVKKLQDKINNLKLIDNKQNKGKGAVVKQGILKAQGKYRLFMDADNSTPINTMDKFWPEFEQNADVVIASIGLPQSKIIEKTSWHRRIMGKWAKYLIQITMLWSIHDSQRGFKCFTAAAAKKIFPKQTIKQWGFDIELLALARKYGFKIKEVPIVWKNIGKSEVNLKAYIKTLGELIKIKWNLISGQYE